MEDFAYLLGALGDASITYRKKKGEYCIEYEQKNKKWLEQSIIPRIEKLYKKVSVKQRKSGLYRVRLYSKRAYFDFIKYWKNPIAILSFNREAQLTFVRGFFDAEGSVPKRHPKTCYRIFILQKDRQVLQIISKILKSVGIITGNIEKNKNIFSLPIRSKRKIQLFSDLIKPEHPVKNKALKDLLCS